MGEMYVIDLSTMKGALKAALSSDRTVHYVTREELEQAERKKNMPFYEDALTAAEQMRDEEKLKSPPFAWKVCPNDQRNIRTYKGDLISSCCVAGQTPEVNAAYIVKAVNIHEEMYEALKKSQFFIESIYHLTGNKEALSYMQRNRAVLDKIEGK